MISEITTISSISVQPPSALLRVIDFMAHQSRYFVPSSRLPSAFE
jgi:hypothetical protein